MADLIIKPASGSDSLIFQDGAGTAVATISTNNVLYGKGVQETSTAISSSSGALTCNLQLGTYFTCTLTENITSVVPSNATSGKLCAWTVQFKQHASSAKTVAYQAAVKFGAGVDHVMTAAVNSIDIVSFHTVDGGTTIFAGVQGSAFA